MSDTFAPVQDEDPVEPYTPGEYTTQVHPWSIITDDIPQFGFHRHWLTKSDIARIERAVKRVGLTELDFGEHMKVKQARLSPDVLGGDLYDRYTSLLTEANHDLDWHFNISGWFESFVYLEYTPGCFNAWHTDYTSTDRTKIGFTTILNEPGKDFKGGEIELLKMGNAPLKKPGDTVVFPGYLTHQVHPITNGVRKTLTGWVGGPPWR